MRASLFAALALGATLVAGGTASAGCVEYGGVTVSIEPSVTVHPVSVNPKDCIGPR